MADETKIKWLYPPDFKGTYDAGTKNGARRYIVLCTNISDGTGEDDEVKIRRTDLLTSDGQVPSKLVVERIDYNINGMRVSISFNNENDELIAYLDDSEGVVDFTYMGGFTPEDDTTNDGGDIVFTTSDEDSGDSYNIILTVRAKK